MQRGTTRSYRKRPVKKPGACLEECLLPVERVLSSKKEPSACICPRKGSARALWQSCCLKMYHSHAAGSAWHHMVRQASFKKAYAMWCALCWERTVRKFQV